MLASDDPGGAVEVVVVGHDFLELSENGLLEGVDLCGVLMIGSATQDPHVLNVDHVAIELGACVHDGVFVFFDKNDIVIGPWDKVPESHSAVTSSPVGAVSLPNSSVRYLVVSVVV